MKSPVIIDHVVKKYGEISALAGVSLMVPRGSLFGLIGPDGAGKTTLMTILASLQAPDSGKVELPGTTGYMPQRFSLYEDLSVGENMRFFADIFGVTKTEREARIKRLLAFSRLGPFQDRRARFLSGGMKQKLALSCALIHTPDILLLDEPTTGVDPVSREEFWAILKELKTEGITILVSTPYMNEAEYCDELALFHQGTILLNGTPDGLVSAFPLCLYEVSSEEKTLHFPANGALPSEIKLIYPAGGTLHAASNEAPEAAVAALRRLIPGEVTIKPIQPRIEDVFFHMLTKHRAAL